MRAMNYSRLFFLVTAVFVLAFASLRADSGFVVVTKDIARVMVLPFGDAKPLGMVRKGEKCKIVSRKDAWFSIEFNGVVGWIYQENVSVVTESVASPAVTPSPSKHVETLLAPAQSAPTAGRRDPENLSPVPDPPMQQQIANSDQHVAGKQESMEEQAQKKPQYKIKKPQNITVDLPPAAVLPMPDNKLARNDISKSLSTSGAVSGAEQPRVRQQFFEITENTARVLAAVSPESPILGIARNSESYPLLYIGTSWCKITFGAGAGWVDRKCGRIVDTPTASTKIPHIVVFALLGGVAALLFLLGLIVVIISLRTKSARKVIVKKDLLIVAKSEKQIQYSLTDSTTTLAKCFSEIGFKVETAPTLERASGMLVHFVPDVVVIDWQANENPLSFLGSLLGNKKTSSDILVLYYNVPEAESAKKRTAMENVHFLGLSFSDRDVFRLVTPVIISSVGRRRSIRTSVETSALGGEIGQGSLIEVMQFIEIGRKTGCLYVVMEKPFGLIYFEQGRLIYAATPTRQGREAVFELLNLKQGHFSFVLDKTSSTKNVDLSTLEILMEWTKTVDEAHRH